MKTSINPLIIDPRAVTDRLVGSIRHQVGEILSRRGVVLGLSGGVDSAVCCALAVRALGAERVFAVLMPERESDPAALELARDLAERLGVEAHVEEITPILEASGCYRRRDEAIRKAVPEFGDFWKCKLVVASDGAGRELGMTRLTVRSPDGRERTVRLRPTEYREILAATSWKQRTRKMIEYYHADRLHYAVLGTPNRLEYDQGFFVKGGDGLADLKPIARLFKSQVYQLAEFLGIPEAITSRPPTTDTYSLPQTQEEFYFALPTRSLDLVLFAYERPEWRDRVAGMLDLTMQRLEQEFRSIERKMAVARYLHGAPLITPAQTDGADAASIDDPERP